MLESLRCHVQSPKLRTFTFLDFSSQNLLANKASSQILKKAAILSYDDLRIEILHHYGS